MLEGVRLSGRYEILADHEPMGRERMFSN